MSGTPENKFGAFKYGKSTFSGIRSYLEDVSNEHQNFNRTGYFLLEHDEGEFVDEVISELEMSRPDIDRYSLSVTGPDGKRRSEAVYLVDDGRDYRVIGTEPVVRHLEQKMQTASFPVDTLLEEIDSLLRDVFDQ